MPKAIESDTTNPVAPTTPITCAALARTLPELWQQRTALDIEILRLLNGTPEKNVARNSFEALQERCDAVESLLLETPATTLEDAEAQLLIIYNWTVDHDEYQIKGLARAAISAFFAVTKAAGINPDDFAFRHLAPFAARPDGGKHSAEI
jgi:hypothetical protein